MFPRNLLSRYSMEWASYQMTSTTSATRVLTEAHRGRVNHPLSWSTRGHNRAAGRCGCVDAQQRVGTAAGRRAHETLDDLTDLFGEIEPRREALLDELTGC
uniref:Uncharacterized protein n=1 Tax=Rhodococcus sp. NS1 TaxID=402236 RepID=A0A097SPR8_9NOCA|nr:hypothetical protein LRS1606.88 [Rhodococcus sp. NS1]